MQPVAQLGRTDRASDFLLYEYESIIEDAQGCPGLKQEQHLGRTGIEGLRH